MKWDEWRGSTDGRPAMYIKQLIKFAGWRVDLHKIVRPDDEGCFHTHPAYAFRFILKGGYIEQLGSGEFRRWKPFRCGIVPPELEHRIAYLYRIPDKPSYSLWIRGPKIAKINMRGC